MRNLRIAELLFNRPLMISEDKLNVIHHVLGPRFNLDLTGMPASDMAALSDDQRVRAGYSVTDGVARIGIFGPLLHRRLAADYPSGGPTTYGEIRSTFDTALADDGVKEIRLEIDSCGGEGSGVFDLADHIFESRAIKPITAVVNERAFSAAYLLASAANKIIIPRTGAVGSIGVIATHVDMSRAEDAAGVTVTHVYSGARKADFSPHKPLAPEALQTLQESVVGMYDMFVEAVARNRGLDPGDVRATEAGLYEGKKAIKAGLADEIASVSSALCRPARYSRSSATGGNASAEIPEGGNNRMNIAELKDKHPALHAEIFGEGKQAGLTEGADVERKRVLAILNIPGPAATAHRALLLEGIDKGQTAGDVALSIQHKEAELLSNAGKDIKDGAVKPAPAVEVPDQGKALDAAIGEAMENAAQSWQKRN